MPRGLVCITGPVQVDFAAVMSRVHDRGRTSVHGESAERCRAQGIDVYQGSASFSAYDTVQVDGAHPIPGHRFVIATGSRPAVPRNSRARRGGIPRRPDALVAEVAAREPDRDRLGAGRARVRPVLPRFGSKVTFLTDSPRILPQDDPEASELLDPAPGRKG